MLHSIAAKEWLTDDVFSLTFKGEGISFRSGQYLLAGPAGLGHLREYSIASAPGAPELRILVKRFDAGLVSPELAVLDAGDALEIRAPFGEFLLPPGRNGEPLLLVATGTGIAPFTSFVAAAPDLAYTLLHGVRYDHQDYLLDEFDSSRCIRCVTRGDAGYPGRVTDYLRDHPGMLDRYGMIYACGNSDMIYELFHLARRAGFGRHQLKAEIYF